MKKVISLIVAFVCAFALVGCFPENTVNIEFPFEPEDVVNIEMYHRSATSESEMKVIESKEDINELYDKFERITYKIKDSEGSSSPEITSFRFNLSDGTNYELVYVGYGVKNGRLKSSTGKFDYFTSADIGWNWKWLNEDLTAIPIDYSEMPK